MSAEFTTAKRKREIRDCALKLKELSSLPANHICADCNYKPAKWCSVNVGCFLCIRCSGIHRSLGVEHSFVRSITLDDWTHELVNAFAAKGGNKRINAVYEAKLDSGGKISHESGVYESIEFITNKYVHQKWMKPLHHHHHHHHHRHRKRNASAKKQKQKHDFRSNENPSAVAVAVPAEPEAAISGDDYRDSWIQFEGSNSGLFSDDTIVIDMSTGMHEPSEASSTPDLLDCSQLGRISFALRPSEQHDDDEAMDSGAVQTDVANDDADIFGSLQMQQQHVQPLRGKAAILSKYEQRNDYPFANGHDNHMSQWQYSAVRAPVESKAVCAQDMNMFRPKNRSNALGNLDLDELNLFQVGERRDASQNKNGKAAIPMPPVFDHFDAFKHLDDLMKNGNGYVFEAAAMFHREQINS